MPGQGFWLAIAAVGAFIVLMTIVAALWVGGRDDDPARREDHPIVPGPDDDEFLP